MARAPRSPSLPTLALAALVALTASAEETRTPSQELSAAQLALEEAELRERMITALAIAEGVRLRGRTVLVAMSETARVRRTLDLLAPEHPDRPELESRLRELEARQSSVDRDIDAEFSAYLEVVSEIASDLWPRLRRVGGDIETALADRRLGNLAEMAPLLREHIAAMNREGAVSLETARRWRAEIDDTYAAREARRDPVRATPAPSPRASPSPAPSPVPPPRQAPAVGKSSSKGEDI